MEGYSCSEASRPQLGVMVERKGGDRERRMNEFINSRTIGI